ncbi:MAG: TIGR03663 family protein [Gammaproteobacteria bacterium]|nr:TIGR03663 family protein [Gammaproteobacteria bacterium]
MRLEDPKFRFSPQWPVAAVVLAALLLVPRFILLDLRPVIHDESMFSFYAYVFANRGAYTHLPILHGPTLLLAVGNLFELFGDSIVVARAFIAFCSLAALAACIGLAPARYRWWFALILFTSPLLLYFSRFMRNEMLYNAAMMIGMLGMAYGLSQSRRHRWWAALGIVAMVALLAIKENVVFIYAAGLTFAIVVWLNRWLPTAPWYRLKSVTALLKGHAIHPRGKRFFSPIAKFGNRSALMTCCAWLGGLFAGVLFVAYIYGTTLTPDYEKNAVRSVVGSDMQTEVTTGKQSLGLFQRTQVNILLMKDSWKNLKRSWDYWKGQQEQHRMAGALHYHVPILLLYELPIIVLLYIGLIWDSLLSRRRFFVYAGSIVAWLLIWWIWRITVSWGPPHWLVSVQEFLHLAPNGSMGTLGLMITPILTWSILAMRQHRLLAAWVGWWAACSIFQYSVAGEKVPWLAVHIVLPLYLTLAWVWAPRLRRFGRFGHAGALIVVVIISSIALRNDVYLIGERAADPRERLVYNHTTPWFDEVVRNRIALWRETGAKIPFTERKVALIGASGWPGIWHFRDTKYQLSAEATADKHNTSELIFGEPNKLSELFKPDDATINTYDGSLRDHWWAPWPDEGKWREWIQSSSGNATDAPGFFELLGSSMGKLWRYYWWRETWTDPGGYPIRLIERR